MRRLGKVCGGLLLSVVVIGMTVWGMGALYYSPLPTFLRQLLPLMFGLATAGAFLSLPQRRRTLLGFGLVWGALVLWWSTIPASNSRDWQPDVAVLPSATLDGDRVTLHNIRNGQAGSRGVQHAYRTKAYGGHLCREVLSAVGRAGSRGQLLAPAFRRRPVGAAPTVLPDARDGAGAGPWPLHVHAWLTLLTQG